MPRTEDRRLLGESELTDALIDLPGWVAKAKQITKTYEFKQYSEGLEFVNALAKLAEELDHHPDLHLSWGKVKVITWTHSSGGVTPLDVKLAAQAEKIFETI